MRRTAAVMILLSAMVRAQAEDLPPELSALRSQFHESISAGDRAVHRQFADNLNRLEKERARAGDYDAAKELRAMRESLLSSTGTADGRATHRLDTTSVSNKGSGLGTLEASGIRFTSTGAFLEWELNAPLKGWYEIMLTHGVEGKGDSSGDVQPLTGPLPADRRSKKANSDNPLPDWGGWVGFEKVSTLNPTNMVLLREIVSTGGL
jgi:hypothetical protein